MAELSSFRQVRSLAGTAQMIPVVTVLGTVDGFNYILADELFTEFSSQLPFSIPGTLTTFTGSQPFVATHPCILVGVRVACGTAPTGASAIFDVNINGVTVFTTQANRPAIAAGALKSTTSAIPNVTALAAGDVVTVDIDQIGSTIPGSDATVVIEIGAVAGIAPAEVPPTPGPPETGFEMPTTDPAGFTRVFEDDFSAYPNIPIGSFPAATGGRWGGYNPGTPDTTGHGDYNMTKTVSVIDGVLDIWLHNEMVGGVQKNWCAAPWPVITDGRAEIFYGQIEFVFRSSRAEGWKTAWLLWPDSRIWPRDGEIDFPEGDLNGISTIKAFMHRQGATVGSDQAHRNSGVVYADNVWHRGKLVWTAGACEFWLDGVKLGPTETIRVPNTPMHWIFQTETRLSGGNPPLGSQGHVQLAWVVCWTKD